MDCNIGWRTKSRRLDKQWKTRIGLQRAFSSIIMKKRTLIIFIVILETFERHWNVSLEM